MQVFANKKLRFYSFMEFYMIYTLKIAGLKFDHRTILNILKMQLYNYDRKMPSLAIAQQCYSYQYLLFTHLHENGLSKKPLLFYYNYYSYGGQWP